MTSEQAISDLREELKWVCNDGKTLLPYDEIRVATIEKDLKRLKTLESYLDKWNEQLVIDGVNSKSMVRNDIQYLINQRNKDNE